MQCSYSLKQNLKSNISRLKIPNSLGDKFSQWDSQNKTLITHYEKKNRDHAKYFLFWENHVSLRIYLIELQISSQNELNISL